MSKTQLKKFLVHLDQEQLKDLIVELYDARPEAKDYLDFYVRPDIDARLEKARNLISKEVRRTQRGYARPRVTKIKRYIRDITSLNPGIEFSIEIMTFAFEALCSQAHMPFMEATQKSTARLLSDIITLSDKNLMLSDFLPRLQKAINKIPKRFGVFTPNRMRSLLVDTLEDCLATLTVKPAL